jgi:hypothetical protein
MSEDDGTAGALSMFAVLVAILIGFYAAYRAGVFG